MNRYELLKDVFFKKIEEKVYGIYKQKAYFHSIQVSQLCVILSKEKNLNEELLAIIGLYHDFSQYIHHNSFNHGKLSAIALNTILKDYQFSDEEISIITTAISNHSEKHLIHDEYSEIVKDADLLAKYYEDSHIVFKPSEQERIKKYIK